MLPIPIFAFMDILVTSATSGEVSPAIEHFRQLGWANPRFLATGVGSVATTYGLLGSIFRQRPGVIIQAGIGGGFSPATKGETYTVQTESFADLGVWENKKFNSLGDMGLAQATEDPLINPYQVLLKETGLPLARGITVNEISTSPERINWLQQNLAPMVESMEGAALHFICLKENIPFLQLRCISNVVGVRDKTQWDIKGAIYALNENLITIIKKIILLDETNIRIQSVPK